jgi:threonine dehydrogenase-like Zn-dependent dehydrogenase
VVRPQASTFKHGTEMLGYSGRSPFISRGFDHTLRLFEDAPARHGFYPRPMGSMVVGTLEWIGDEVATARPDLQVGISVFAWAPIADAHVLPAEAVSPLGALTPQQALCIDPASFALGGVIDGAVAASETVLVTGLGAIGLLTVQYCRALGATVLATSRLPVRRKLAEVFGAEVLVPGAGDDLARLIKHRTGGVDVAIECAGSAANLTLAIRATRQCGRVVCVGFQGAGEDIHLGEEFYHNRLTLLASLPALSWNNPTRGTPPLYAKDLQAMNIRDFAAGKITADGLLDPVLPFRDAERAVALIAEAPERVIKVMLTHD